mmetsp:Transcript_20832/g.50357  ORF Transcript_20832/g.50357 Transcript_20832/m.50357 type:complete len:258 (-) Transcript_20832:192-965(-)
MKLSIPSGSRLPSLADSSLTASRWRRTSGSSSSIASVWKSALINERKTGSSHVSSSSLSDDAASAFRSRSTPCSWRPSSTDSSPSPRHARHSTEKKPCASATLRALSSHHTDSCRLPAVKSLSAREHISSPWSRKRSILPRRSTRRDPRLAAESACCGLPVDKLPRKCAMKNQERMPLQAASGCPSISSSMRTSHSSTPRHFPAVCAASTFAQISFIDSGGAHLFLWRLHPAFWHSAPQYQTCLQIEQRFSAPCFPQ